MSERRGIGYVLVIGPLLVVTIAVLSAVLSLVVPPLAAFVGAFVATLLGAAAGADVMRRKAARIGARPQDRR
ncbi:MAG: hypothetical protein S0880_15875 [Actinomycetota bacterium]|nr:hypothetical protein [Actinomycetota bacterium]